MIINIKDTFGKVTAVVSMFHKMLDGLSDLMASINNGPPGKVVRAVCFDPETIIQTHNGDFVKMQDIELNTILKNLYMKFLILVLNQNHYLLKLFYLIFLPFYPS